MKRQVSTGYAFTPAQARLDLSGIAGLTRGGLLAVLDVSAGTLLYAAATPGFGASFSGLVLTLQAPMAGLAGTDALAVIFDDGAAGALDRVPERRHDVVPHVLGPSPREGALQSDDAVSIERVDGALDVIGGFGRRCCHDHFPVLDGARREAERQAGTRRAKRLCRTTTTRRKAPRTTDCQ